jgi:hypothetical protein
MKLNKLTSIQLTVAILAVLTGLMHLIYGVFGLMTPSPSFFAYLFVLNFLGNIFLVWALYFSPFHERWHEIIRWSFVAYTLSSIIGYIYVYYPGGIRSLLFPAGFFDKLMEIFLVVSLILERPLGTLQKHHHPKGSTLA